jgi:hypothetical protein
MEQSVLKLHFICANSMLMQVFNYTTEYYLTPSKAKIKELNQWAAQHHKRDSVTNVQPCNRF